MNHFGYQVFCLDQFSRRSPNLSALYGTQKRCDSNGPASIFFLSAQTIQWFLEKLWQIRMDMELVVSPDRRITTKTLRIIEQCHAPSSK